MRFDGSKHERAPRVEVGQRVIVFVPFAMWEDDGTAIFGPYWEGKVVAERELPGVGRQLDIDVRAARPHYKAADSQAIATFHESYVFPLSALDRVRRVRSRIEGVDWEVVMLKEGS